MIYWFSGWRPSGGMVIGVDYTVGPLRAGCRPGLPAGSSDDVLTDLGRLHSGLVGDQVTRLAAGLALLAALGRSGAALTGYP